MRILYSSYWIDKLQCNVHQTMSATSVNFQICWHFSEIQHLSTNDWKMYRIQHSNRNAIHFKRFHFHRDFLYAMEIQRHWFTRENLRVYISLERRNFIMNVITVLFDATWHQMFNLAVHIWLSPRLSHGRTSDAMASHQL